MTTYEIYTLKVKSNPVFKMGYIVGYDTIQTHTIIVEDIDELLQMIDEEVCYDIKCVGNITARELKESADRILVTK